MHSSSLRNQDQLPKLENSLQATSEHAAIAGKINRDERLLTVQEVAELLHVPTSWVYERTRRRGGDQLPYVKLGKYLRFEEAAIVDFIRGVGLFRGKPRSTD